MLLPSFFFCCQLMTTTLSIAVRSPSARRATIDNNYDSNRYATAQNSVGAAINELATGSALQKRSLFCLSLAGSIDSVGLVASTSASGCCAGKMLTPDTGNCCHVSWLFGCNVKGNHKSISQVFVLVRGFYFRKNSWNFFNISCFQFHDCFIVHRQHL